MVFSKSPGHQPHDPWHHFVGLRLFGLRQHRGEQQRRQATKLVPVDQWGLDQATGPEALGGTNGTPIAGWFMTFMMENPMKIPWKSHENPMKMDENYRGSVGVALFQKKNNMNILWMEEIMHHLGWNPL